MDHAAKTWRLELFFKTAIELTSKQLPIVKKLGIKRFNVTNKKKEDNLLEDVQIIQKEIPEADVCVHYALKWNYSGGVEAGMRKFNDFLSQLESMNASVLLVLRQLQEAGPKPATPVHVAFNPYFPQEADTKREQKRMEQKLRTGMVSGIWLQTGSDLKKLEAGLMYLKKLTEADPVPIYGSFFLPTKRLLAQMKFRPWNGVFLSDEYLSDVDAATNLTKSLLACYREHQVVPLLETAVRTAKDWEAAKALLEI